MCCSILLMDVILVSDTGCNSLSAIASMYEDAHLAVMRGHLHHQNDQDMLEAQCETDEDGRKRSTKREASRTIQGNLPQAAH